MKEFQCFWRFYGMLYKIYRTSNGWDKAIRKNMNIQLQTRGKQMLYFSHNCTLLTGMCFLILGYVVTGPPITSFSSTFRRVRIAEFNPTSFVEPNFLLISVTRLLWFQLFLSVFYFQTQTLSSARLQDAVVLPCRKTNEKETAKTKCSSNFGNCTSDIKCQHLTDT